MLENNLEAVARHMLFFSLALEDPEKMGLQGQLQRPISSVAPNPFLIPERILAFQWFNEKTLDIVPHFIICSLT